MNSYRCVDFFKLFILNLILTAAGILFDTIFIMFHIPFFTIQEKKTPSLFIVLQILHLKYLQVGQIPSLYQYMRYKISRAFHQVMQPIIYKTQENIAAHSTCMQRTYCVLVVAESPALKSLRR